MCTTINATVITIVTFACQLRLTEKIVAISYFALIVLFLLLRIVFVKYEFKFFAVLGFTMFLMVVFVRDLKHD